MPLAVATMPATKISSTSVYPLHARAGTARLGGRGRAARPAPVSLLRLIVIGFGIANADVILELEEVLLSDAANVHQLFDLLERTVLLPVLHDERGGLCTNAWQTIELGCRCRVDVDDLP